MSKSPKWFSMKQMIVNMHCMFDKFITVRKATSGNEEKYVSAKGVYEAELWAVLLLLCHFEQFMTRQLSTNQISVMSDQISELASTVSQENAN